MQRFVSRPDLTPPVLDVRTPASPEVSPGSLFFTARKGAVQKGPLIMDDNGQLIWSGTRNPGAADFRMQEYRGQPVLTFWQGRSVGDGGHADGQYYILDRSYRQIASVRAGNGLQGDLHEFTLTPNGTALITSYVPTPTDLSGVGGPRNGWALDGVFQEIDVASGRVVSEWHSLRHVPVTDSYIPVAGRGTRDNPLDYFHINSVERESGGDYLVSARHTQGVYRIDGPTGRLEWLLGGKRSSFAMGQGTPFAWQHDARFVDADTVSLFDNADDNPSVPPNRAPSRAVLLDLDPRGRTAALAAEYPNPAGLVSATQGNARVQPDGNVFVGWGAQPYLTEFDQNGKVLFDATFGAGLDSYRAYRSEWHATPTEAPTAVGVAAANGSMDVAVSWNGATEVRSWRLLTGARADTLTEVSTVDRAGFETIINAPRAAFAQMQAVDGAGTVIGKSAVIRVP